MGCQQDPPPPASTVTPSGSGGAKHSSNYGLIDPLGNVSFQTIIARFIRVALGLVGALLLAMFIYGGFFWTTAGGDAQRVQRAKDILRNAVIGLVIVGLSYTLINLLFSLTNTALGG